MAHTKNHKISEHDLTDMEAGTLMIREDHEGAKSMVVSHEGADHAHTNWPILESFWVPEPPEESESVSTSESASVSESQEEELHWKGHKLATTEELLAKIAELQWAIANIRTAPPIGTIFIWPGAYSLRPSYTLLCNGAAISRTTYANLYNIIGTTYGTGDGSTTFNLPNFNGRFPMGTTSSSNLGAAVAAGLPNITGTARMHYAQSNAASGAFSSTAGDSKYYAGAGSTGNNQFSFSAKSSNSIYGASSTVQPPAYRVYYLIVAV